MGYHYDPTPTLQNEVKKQRRNLAKQIEQIRLTNTKRSAERIIAGLKEELKHG